MWKIITKEGTKLQHEQTCQFCEKTFTRKQSLRSHIKFVHGEKPYICDFCVFHCQLTKFKIYFLLLSELWMA